MSNKRNIVDLLRILVVYATKRFNVPDGSTPTGLCACVGSMAGQGMITEDERDELFQYLDRHRPTEKDGEHYDHKRRNGLWYWEIYQGEPRIAWLRYRLSIEKEKMHQKSNHERSKDQI